MRNIVKLFTKGGVALIVMALAFLALMGIARAGQMTAKSDCKEASISWQLPEGENWKRIEEDKTLVVDLYHPDGTVERGLPVAGTRPAVPGGVYRAVWRDPTAIDWSGEWGEASITAPGLAVCPAEVPPPVPETPVVPPPPADVPPPAEEVPPPPVVDVPAPPVVNTPAPPVTTTTTETELPDTGRAGTAIMVTIAALMLGGGYALYRASRRPGYVSLQMRGYRRFVQPRALWLHTHLVLSFRRVDLWSAIFAPPEMYMTKPSWLYFYPLAS